MLKLTPSQTQKNARGAAVLVFMFGLLTLISGSTVLFGPESFSRMAGEVVDFVLWFNVLSVPLYLLAGAGLWRGSFWIVGLSAFMALMCALVLLALLLHISTGEAYESRTLVAMSFRLVFWALLYGFVARRFMTKPRYFE